MNQNNDLWERDKICHFLSAGIRSVVKFDDLLEAVRQAECYLKNIEQDSTIKSHLSDLYPRLGWLKDTDSEMKALNKDRKLAFRNTFLGAVVGAFIGLFGSVLFTYYTILNQNQISQDTAILEKQLISNVTNQLSLIEAAIEQGNVIYTDKYKALALQIKNLNSRVENLEKKYLKTQQP